MGQAQSSSLNSCLKIAVGSSNVAFPGLLYQIGYVKRYNLNIAVSPLAITYPSTNNEVAEIITCARNANVKVQARSGGHSYGNFGLGGGNNDTVVVDLSNFKQFEIDTTSWVATFGAGMLLQNVTDSLDIYNRAMAHGTCPQVGIGGHATIGGLGPMSRMWGAALDHVVEVDVVLANSSIITASNTSYPDIFWGLKGAGASYGVITQFKVITHAPPSQTTQYSYVFSTRPFSKLASQFKAWQNLISQPDLSRKFASQLILSEAGMIIEGTYFGSQAEFEALNMTAVFPEASSSNVTVFNTWLGQVAQWGQDVALTLGGGISSYFYAKSLAFTPNDLMSDAAIDAWFRYLDEVDKGTLIWFAIYDLEGGATNDVPLNATAYAHRNALYYLQTYAIDISTVSNTTHDFVQGMSDIITNSMPGHTLGSYPGYVDPDMANAQEMYWNTNYPQMQALKLEVDPHNMFSNPQSVQLP